ncbi:hypothetical protein [Chitinophaga varians]|uniref:hypothetical protein n=1 Tax=Chitinophaga varians TaxID=2202339 RepID=UPI00165EC6AB|nr:hypothetical protein [Chitinophaga varians]MBC9914926.1 hypothetical protein [Chitinophaga varians]
MENKSNDQTAAQATHSNTGIRSLEPLIGTWQLGGDTSGTVQYQWLEGGFFILQRVDMKLFGNHIVCLEVIGHMKPFGQEADEQIRSKVYDNAGNTLDYVYELEGNTLTIWGGEKGSPAFFRGTFNEAGDFNSGEWVYPGGGYKSTMQKIQ